MTATQVPIANTQPCTACGEPSRYSYRETEYDRIGLVAAESVAYACVDHRRTIASSLPTRASDDCDECSPERCRWPQCRMGEAG